MSEPIRNSNRDKTATSVIIPSPTGGWNKRDSYALMPITDAIVMDNWIPRESFVELRKGFQPVAVAENPTANVIETLMNYNVSQNEQLLAAFGGSIYKANLLADLESSNFVNLRSPQAEAFTSNKWNYTLYKKTLIMVNGKDHPQFYVGRVSDPRVSDPSVPDPSVPDPSVKAPRVSDPSVEDTSIRGVRIRDVYIRDIRIRDAREQSFLRDTGSLAPVVRDTTEYNNVEVGTGVMPIRFDTNNAQGQPDSTFDAKKLNNVVVYRNRLFFTEKDSLKLWYAETAASVPNITLNSSLKLKSFDLDQFAKKGGSLAGVDNWTKTGAEGFNNLLIVVTTAGETFVYDGTNPSDENNWKLLGIYQIPKILGTRSFEKLGADLVILTEEGYFSIAGLLNADYVGNNTAISNKIDGAIKELNKYSFNYWQIKYVPNENLLLVNVPRYQNIQDETNQHVLNVSTGAWCRFTDINATCFEVFKGETYFAGTRGNLYKMFAGTKDDKEKIQSHLQQAYSNFESAKLKSFKLAKFVVSAALETILETDFIVDFMRSSSKYKSSLKSVQTMWDVAKWDVSLWSSEKIARIVSVALQSLPGYYGSIELTTSTTAADVEWYSTLVILTLEK